MRKLVLYTLMSLDGDVDDPSRYYVAGQGDNEPPEFDSMMEANEEQVIGSQDTVLLGRGMYDEWVRFWPKVENHAFADFINGVEKIVVTSTPLAPSWHNAKAASGPVGPLVAELKARPGGDIGVHGSITLAQSLLREGLVDEIRLVVGPSVGFGGRRLFPTDGDIRRLELISAVPTPGGSVLLGYRMRPARS